VQKIIVFGATGGTGTCLVQAALHAGHFVTVVVRNPDLFIIRHERLVIIKGDVFQPGTFEREIADKDAVVSCLGTRKRGQTTVYSDGVTNIISAMKAHSVSRIICLSAGAVIVPPKGSFMTKFFIKNILQRALSHVYGDMLIMERILETSGLHYTIIRAPWLRNTHRTGKYRTANDEHLSNPSMISRADLADYIVNHLNDVKTFRSRVEISY
jgi:putative NADH-flavin reductase